MKNHRLFTRLIFLVSATILVSCEEIKVQPTEEYYSVIKATLDTGFPSQIEQDSVLYTSSILKLGTSGVKSYGVCYGLNPNPTLKDFVVSSTKAIDSIPLLYRVKIKNLKNGTTYQIRSFIATATDTVYGAGNFVRTHGKNEWTTREKVPSPNLSQYAFTNTTFFNDKKIFMLYKDENRLLEYDISRFAWVTKKPLPSSVKGKTDKYSFMINGKGYCGNLAKPDTKLEHELWEYDLLTDNWRNLDGNIPNLQTTDCFGFNDKQYGYVTARASNNTWQIWRLDANGFKWSLINESFQSNGNGILRLISDGINTFALTGDKKIYQFKNQKWEYFLDMTTLLNGRVGYYGWVYQNTLLMGEYDPVAGGAFKSINITTKAVDDQLTNQIFRLQHSFSSEARGWEVGPIQTANKIFYVELTSPTPIDPTPLRLREYYPK